MNTAWQAARHWTHSNAWATTSIQQCHKSVSSHHRSQLTAAFKLYMTRSQPMHTISKISRTVAPPPVAYKDLYTDSIVKHTSLPSLSASSCCTQLNYHRVQQADKQMFTSLSSRCTSQKHVFRKWPLTTLSTTVQLIWLCDNVCTTTDESKITQRYSHILLRAYTRWHKSSARNAMQTILTITEASSSPVKVLSMCSKISYTCSTNPHHKFDARFWC